MTRNRLQHGQISCRLGETRRPDAALVALRSPSRRGDAAHVAEACPDCMRKRLANAQARGSILFTIVREAGLSQARCQERDDDEAAWVAARSVMAEANAARNPQTRRWGVLVGVALLAVEVLLYATRTRN